MSAFQLRWQEIAIVTITIGIIWVMGAVIIVTATIGLNVLTVAIAIEFSETPNKISDKVAISMLNETKTTALDPKKKGTLRSSVFVGEGRAIDNNRSGSKAPIPIIVPRTKFFCILLNNVILKESKTETP
ncbi:hypothetical protein [Microcoleus sp. B4-D4]|uniref:hypothetical protein n=1 Tax=Microcoleus sp. B4-D4 TaxID=2818667 RepID=UPI002FD44988